MEKQIERLKERYIFSQPLEVLKKLYNNPKLADFLWDAYEKIKEVFVSEKLELKILYDPEIVGWEQLTIAIHTDLDGDEAYEKIKLLDRSWWLDASQIVDNELGINIDFNEI